MKDDIQFLKELQKELKTQEVDSQAAPRFWVIMDYRETPTHEDYDYDRTSYFHNDGDVTEFFTVQELRKFIMNHYFYDNESDELKEILNNSDLNFDELWEYVEENLNEDGWFNSVPVKEESFIVPDTMFLTKEEAQKHLRLNKHHYTSKAHTYAMTAWRSPKVAKLFDILETFDWDQISK